MDFENDENSELLGFREFYLFFRLRWKAFLFICLTGSLVGFGYSVYKKNYRSILVFNSTYGEFPVDDDELAINKNYSKLFKQKAIAQVFAEEFISSLFKADELSFADLSSQKRALAYFNLKVESNREERQNATQSLENRLIRSSQNDLFFEFKFTPQSSYELSFWLSERGIEVPLTFSLIRAFNLAVNKYNNNMIEIIRKERQLNVEQVAKNFESVQFEYVQSISSLAKEKVDLKVRLYSLKNKIAPYLKDGITRSIEDDFISLMEKSPLLFLALNNKEGSVSNISQFDETSLFQKLAHIAVNGRVKEERIDLFLSEFASIRSGFEIIEFKHLPVNLAYESNVAALKAVQDLAASPIEIRKVGLRSVVENWESIFPQLSIGSYTKEHPSMILSVLIGAFVFVILYIIGVFITLIFFRMKNLENGNYEK